MSSNLQDNLFDLSGKVALITGAGANGGIGYAVEFAGSAIREMPVEVGPEKRVGSPPDTLHIVAPRGARTVAGSSRPLS